MDQHTSILITGAAGFVGSHIFRIARDAGLSIRTHSRCPVPGIELSAELSDPVSVRSLALDGIRAVIHCAAAIPSRSDAFARDNTGSASVLAEALLEARALRRVIHVSSIAVYRRPISANWVISEEAEVVDTTDDRIDPYARSKRNVELALDGLALQRREVSVFHLRASSIYGPGMLRTTLLPALVDRARRNEPLVLRGPRAFRQNFVHIEDIASLAVAMACEASETEPIVNAFSNDTFGLFELAELIREKLGSSSALIDETENICVPHQVFVNRRFKDRRPDLLRLRDSLQDVAA